VSRDYLWFQFWASDALSSSEFQMASLEERGLWITLVSMMWVSGGPLPYEPERLARACGTTEGEFQVLIKLMDGGLLRRDGGKLRSDRLEEEREASNRRRRKAKKAVSSRRDRTQPPTKPLLDSYSSSTKPPTQVLPVSSQESVVSSQLVSNQESEVSRQDERLETPQSDSPVTKAPDREPAVRAPSSADRASEDIREYLGDHASVVQHLQETLSEGEARRVMLSVSARWLPGGSMFKDWDTTPEDRRPAMLATALADFPWNGVVDLQHLRGFLRRVVRGEHKAKETEEGWAWTEAT